MTKANRVLSVMVAAVLIMSLGTAAFAAEPDHDGTYGIYIENGAAKAGEIGGEWSYDAESNVLSVKGCEIEGYDIGIYAVMKKGETLTIEADGLSVSAGKTGILIETAEPGKDDTCSLLIDGGSIAVKAGEMGIYADGSLTAQGAEIKVECTEKAVAAWWEDTSLSDCTLDIYSENGTAIYGNLDVTVSGCSGKAVSNDNVKGNGIFSEEGDIDVSASSGKLVIESASDGIWANGGKVTAGGNLEVKAEGTGIYSGNFVFARESGTTVCDNETGITLTGGKTTVKAATGLVTGVYADIVEGKSYEGVFEVGPIVISGKEVRIEGTEKALELSRLFTSDGEPVEGIEIAEGPAFCIETGGDGRTVAGENWGSAKEPEDESEYLDAKVIGVLDESSPVGTVVFALVAVAAVAGIIIVSKKGKDSLPG